MNDKYQKLGDMLIKTMVAQGNVEFDMNGDLLITDKGMNRIDELIKTRVHDIMMNKMLDKASYYKLLDKERDSLLKSVQHPVEALIVLEGEQQVFDKYHKFNKESLH